MRLGLLCFAFALAAASLCMAQTAAPVDRFRIPSTVSAEAAAELAPIYRGIAQRPPQQRPTSMAEWDQRAARTEATFAPRAAKFAQSLGVTAIDDKIGDVAVLRVRPAAYRPGGPTLLYLHGGGYVQFSPRSSLIAAALVAAGSGNEVVAVDYTLAPRGTWRTATDQVLAVWRGLLSAGASARSLGVFGDSAGGGLAAGSILKMRDQGLPLPGALWLLSPWSDITSAGDSYTTLAAADPILNNDASEWNADAYAPVADQKNPYVSPVYGDYSKAFPATLIQVGTREIFLSNAVREYQAIRDGGHDAVLDVYEGMPHVFQQLAPMAPETRAAVARAVSFLESHLAPR